MPTDADADLMGRAMRNAATVRLITSPNPWVGAVVCTGTGEVFDGATRPPGGPHAERVALDAAGQAAAGATLYTTLEPCSHRGRTGPCTDAILASGIARVVVGIADPDPQVAGSGIEALRDAGVDVAVGVGEDAVRRQLEPYLHHRRTGRPFVVLKLAASLDGKTAAADGSSRWITGPEARATGHRLRAESDAVVVGAATVRADDPLLTVRDWAPGEGIEPGELDPLRVVLGRAPTGARIRPCLELDGDVGAILRELGARGVLQVLVEGGAATAAQFHEAGLVDRYELFLAPALFGGSAGPPMLAGRAAPTMDEVWRGRIETVERLGDDLHVVVVPQR